MGEDVRERLVQLSPGVIAERDVLNIIGKVQEYDPNLVVQYLDPAYGAEIDSAPWRIMERCPDGILRLVFSVWELDDRVLQRLYAADTHKQDVLLNLDQHNNIVRQDGKRRFEDRRLEAQDIVAHMVASPKGRWSFSMEDTDGERKKVTVDDSSLHQKQSLS